MKTYFEIPWEDQDTGEIFDADCFDDPLPRRVACAA